MGKKGLCPSKGIYVRVKREIAKFCNKSFMKVNLPVEFNRGKYGTKITRLMQKGKDD